MDLTNRTLVLQYEARIDHRVECGGGYIKLFSAPDFTPEDLSRDTPYMLMFGPDKCGPANAVHFIIVYRHPVTGQRQERVMKAAPPIQVDGLNHLYTLIVRPDNCFEILIDNNAAKSGSLFDSFTPSFIPPTRIDDPADLQPRDWVTQETINDPHAMPPDNFEREFIPDPAKATPPPGWIIDDQGGRNPKCEDAPGCGPYEPPLVPNPNFRGHWPQIPNPEYKGPFRPRQIPNPDYIEDPHTVVFEPVAGMGFELWTTHAGISFANLWLGVDEAALHQWNNAHFIPKTKEQRSPTRTRPAGRRRRSIIMDVPGALWGAWHRLYESDRATTIAWTALAVACPLVLRITFWLRGAVLLGQPPTDRVESAKGEEEEAAAEPEPAAEVRDEDAPTHRVPRAVTDDKL
jgi:calnexin